MRYWGWGAEEPLVVETHERFFVFLYDGGCVVSCVELRVALLDIARPFVGDVRLELSGFAGARAVGDHDACAEGEVVRVLIFVDWSDEVCERVLVDVREAILVAIVDAVDAWWVGVGPG